MSSRNSIEVGGALYFYKGTAFPISTPNNLQEDKKSVEEMILLGLKHGISLKEQIKEYKQQLDLIEESIYKNCNPSSAKGLKKMEQQFGKSIPSLMATWILNIIALLRLKAITNDNDNGIVIIE